jgi:putative solute:sodium symporter small subunit
MSNSEHYDVNFFKPLSEHAKANKKLIIILATFWAVGVFGFQILLMVFNERVPEESYLIFDEVYPEVTEDVDVYHEKKVKFAKSLLYVLGKNIAVQDDHKNILKKSFSWAALSLQPDSLKPAFLNDPAERSIARTITVLGLTNEGFDKIMSDLVPSSLVKLNSMELSQECKSQLPDIMALYLIHNRSFLTDFNFIGFPFHYWYTAQFLLIMFVVLCVVYATSIEKANKKYDFVEET